VDNTMPSETVVLSPYLRLMMLAPRAEAR